MSDRELLELAAKAAGYEISYIGPSDDVHIRLRKGVCREFNPLTDDGDALRLAVKLGFGVECRKDGHVYVWRDKVLMWNGFALHEKIEEEKIAATRRAIVRAAAEIGKGMK